MRRLRAGILAVAAAAGILIAAPAQATTGAGTPGFCPDADGVTVIVDFQELGGSTIVRCAPGDQASGLTALKNAGFQITGVQRWGEAFICRIEGKPGAADEACINTPPATAYWSYWHSPNNGSWTYSQWGVMARKPPKGSFEGWSFSKDKTADTSPPPRVGPSRPAPPDNGGGDDGGDNGNPGGGDPDPQKPGEPAKPGEPGASPSASASPSTVASSGEAAPGPSDLPSEAPGWTGGEELARNAEKPSGVPAGTFIALGAVIVLGVSGAVIGIRRKKKQT
ncbi:hypothetical protein Afil01_54030 [Actinorhabdospora filicis]|uniref:Uncharacterized protein n=2 Tax=Actinorhabdospora filicis TaxID=1785913 RepID=A0A9W6SQU3_9ACTN|nr:hypothetical protein Afil01_54030 [Actinorhabdospora filicis]